MDCLQNNWDMHTRAVVIFYILPMVAADDGGINWPTVAVAWVFSLLTSVLVVVLALVVMRCLRYRRKKKNVPPKISRELSVVSEASDMTRVSAQSTHPLYSNGPGYRRVPSRESNINRRKSDFLSSWCGKHGLSEIIAANLRENGFTSREQLESLQPGDVITLGLPNLAQQVQLRGVLENIQKSAKEPRRSSNENAGVAVVPNSVGKPRQNSLSSDRSRPRSSTTNEDVSFSASSPRQISSPTTPPSSFPFSEGRSLLHHSTDESLSLAHHSHKIAVLPGRTPRSRLRFNGLLSDSGLYELAESLGAEWRHLAAILGMHKAYQEQLMQNYPGNTKQQIYEMLRHWRENEPGEKEQVKAALSKGFLGIKRKDLADRVLREQVHGSDEHLRVGHRINSVV